MKIIALTGGIASGKSTVSQMFQKCGAVCIDADKLAHQSYLPKTELYQQILFRYGSQVIDPQTQKIDRAKLADILFSKPQEKKWLELQIHPVTRRLIGEKIQAAIKKCPTLILVEAALHAETGYYLAFQGLIVVDVTRSVQLERLRQRDGLSLEAAKRRLTNQWSLAKKRKLADWVIDNSGSLKNTQKQVKKLYGTFLSNPSGL